MRSNNSTNRKEKEENNDISFSIYSPLLSDRHRAILQSIKVDYLEYALLYLKDHGFTFEDSKYYKLKLKSLKNDSERIIQIRVIISELKQKTLNIEIDLNKMWQKGNNEKDLYKKEVIGKRIIAIQHYFYIYSKTIDDILLTYFSKTD